MNTLKNLFTVLTPFLNPNPVCIETGVQHQFDEKEWHIYSTTNIIEHIVIPKNGILYSFDIDADRIDRWKNDVRHKNIHFIVGDSVEKIRENIPRIGKVDFVFLDSKEFDEYHMLEEFKIIEPHLNDKCIICCDDIHNLSSTKYKRAVPYIKEKVDMWFEYSTHTGLFVGIRTGG